MFRMVIAIDDYSSFNSDFLIIISIFVNTNSGYCLPICSWVNLLSYGNKLSAVLVTFGMGAFY